MNGEIGCCTGHANGRWWSDWWAGACHVCYVHCAFGCEWASSLQVHGGGRQQCSQAVSMPTLWMIGQRMHCQYNASMWRPMWGQASTWPGWTCSSCSLAAASCCCSAVHPCRQLLWLVAGRHLPEPVPQIKDSGRPESGRTILQFHSPYMQPQVGRQVPGAVCGRLQQAGQRVQLRAAGPPEQLGAAAPLPERLCRRRDQGARSLLARMQHQDVAPCTQLSAVACEGCTLMGSISRILAPGATGASCDVVRCFPATALAGKAPDVYDLLCTRSTHSRLRWLRSSIMRASLSTSRCGTSMHTHLAICVDHLLAVSQPHST